MRQIKFRAWVGRREMRYFPELSEHTRKFAEEYTDADKERGGAILMQFTGLLDKNGKEIYEGDILKALVESDFGRNFETMTVDWHDERARYITRSIGHIGENGKGLIAKLETQKISYEIIGNIYENPELLK